MDSNDRAIIRGFIRGLQAEAGKHGGTLVSLYVPPTMSKLQASSLISVELGLAGNIKDRVTRNGIHDALQNVLRILGEMSGTSVGTNGLAIFASPVDDHVFYPPQPLRSKYYHCGRDYLTDPMQEWLADEDCYGLICLDRGEVTLGILRGTVIQHVFDEQSHIMGKHQAGGQSAHRYERQIEEETRNFYGRAAERINNALLPLVGELSGILIGGPGYGKNEWLDAEYLDYRLKSKVVRPAFDIGYTSDSGLRELVARAGATLRNLASAQEATLVSRFVAAVAAGTAAYTHQVVQQYIDVGNASEVLVSEAHLDELHDLSAKMTLHIISAESEAGKRFLAFSGLGCFLRFGNTEAIHE